MNVINIKNDIVLTASLFDISLTLGLPDPCLSDWQWDPDAWAAFREPGPAGVCCHFLSVADEIHEMAGLEIPDAGPIPNLGSQGRAILQ